MIDLHSHILPGMDDGAETMEDGIEMARMAADTGTKVILASSHGDFSRISPEDWMKKYNSRLRHFRQEVKRNNIGIQVASGAELLVNDALIRCAGKHHLPSLNHGSYILAEFEFDISADLMQKYINTLTDLGWRIVLAHPERYDCVKRDVRILFPMYEKGILLQVNKGSLSGMFGRGANRIADIMLGEGIAGIVASDAHDPLIRTPELDETADNLDLYYGNNASEILLRRNPCSVLTSRPYEEIRN